MSWISLLNLGGTSLGAIAKSIYSKMLADGTIVGGPEGADAIPLPVGISRKVLSESSNGEAINILVSSSPGTVVHVVPPGKIDEVWLWVNAFGSGQHASLVINGGEKIEQDISSEEGFTLVCPGVRFPGGTILSCLADNDGSIVGHINRIH